MNFCKDCKHKFNGRIIWKGYALTLAGDNCSFAVRGFDPVEGHVVNYRELIDCRESRAEISHIENKCGPEGKHFEAKD